MAKETFYRLKESKRNKIEKALISVFGHQGYDFTSVNDLIKACGIPRGSFYQYFNDKFDAFYYLIEKAQKAKMIYMEPLMNRIGQEKFLDVYMDMLEAGLKFTKDNPELSNAAIHLHRSTDQAVRTFRDNLSDLGIKIITELLEKDQQAGNIRTGINLKMVAKILYQINSVDVINEYIAGNNDEIIKKISIDYLNILRHGIGKEENDEK